MSSFVDKKQFGGNTGPPVGRMYLKNKGWPSSGDLVRGCCSRHEFLVNLIIVSSAQCWERNVVFHLFLLFVASGILLHHPANIILPSFIAVGSPCPKDLLCR